MTSKKQNIDAKNALRLQASLSFINSYGKLLKESNAAALRGDAGFTSNAREYAIMVSAFNQAEEAHVDWLVLQGLMPGQCEEHDPWLSDLRSQMEAIPGPPVAAPTITGAALATGITLGAAAADVDARAAALGVGAEADLGALQRCAIQKLLAMAWRNAFWLSGIISAA